MKFLFVHQNFPGQYLHIVRHLAAAKRHDVVFITEPNGNWISGARTVPFAVFTSRMSPRSMFSRCAVSGCSSTHELQQILLTGSGSSCNQGLFAPRPSPSAGDG